VANVGVGLHYVQEFIDVGYKELTILQMRW